jgi:phosphate transport system substrate-binding protein
MKTTATRFLMVAASILAAGCKPGGGGEPGEQEVRSLDGAGASFPYPIYSQWAYDYEKAKGLKLNYQSIGSGGGIAQIKAKVVDFGASDAPLEKEELDEAGLIQFPLIMGGVVPVVNLEGVSTGELKLSAPVLVDIFLGEIRWWSDPAIKAHNPDVELPDKEITVVHRADGSGTTWIFTNYLAKVSGEWKERVGTGKAVEWPAGVGGKGNEGVAQYVQKIRGSIGYVEFAYALENEIPYAQLKNKAGAFVSPTIDSFQAAAASADWKSAPGFYMVLTDQPGEGSWPITGASFILVYKEQPDAAKARAMLEFFAWCFETGGEAAERLHYVPMPEAVVTLVQDEWRAQVRAGGRPVWD